MADNRLLDPPAEAIQTGYYLTKAREHIHRVPVIDAKDGTKYTIGQALWYAHEAAMKATPIVVKQSGMFWMQPEAGLAAIHDAYAGLHKVGAAHDIFRRLMKELGYRDITARDFAEYGSGGDR